MSVPNDAHLAYLNRRLDLKEREIAVREHEAEIEDARLDLERDKFEWVKAQQAEDMKRLDDLRVMIDQSDDGMTPMPRKAGRA